jgi:hypothetical protein
MTRVVPDRSFGNRGTLWTGMPYLYRNSYSAYEEYHYVGGTATGLTCSRRVPRLLLFGVGISNYHPDVFPHFTTVRLVVFPPDGSPQEHLRADGTLTYDVSEVGRMATPLASCSTPSQDVAILIGQDPVRQNAFLPPEYKACIVSPAIQVTRPLVRPEWLYDSRGAAQPGNVRMAYDAPISASSRRKVHAFALRRCAVLPPCPEMSISPSHAVFPGSFGSRLHRCGSTVGRRRSPLQLI